MKRTDCQKPGWSPDDVSVSCPALRIWNGAEPVEAAEWIAAWQDWPEREVFAHPSYVQLYTEAGQSHALCAVWQSEGVRVLYPFILRNLSREPYWAETLGPATDIATPYGYGGPVAWGAGDLGAAMSAFWHAFEEWAGRQGVVAEFIRFALGSPTMPFYPGEQCKRLDNIVRTLDEADDALWSDFKPKLRRNINRAQENGVRVVWDPAGDRLDEFLRVYEHTLRRRAADPQYFFPRSFFEQIHRTLPGQFTYGFGLHEGQVVEVELVLLSRHSAYSFLGGTDGSRFHVRPNDLLKYELIRWAKAQGKRRVVLGGGNQPDDGIYHYKKSFAPNGSVPFYVGQRILRPDVYDALVENRKVLAERQGIEWTPREHYFPRYRA